jgi:hypothetical protein
MARKIPAKMTRHLNIKLDEQTFTRLEQNANSRGVFLSEAVRECINGNHNEFANDLRVLQLDMKEIRLLLQDILPQLATKKEAQGNFDAVGKILEVMLQKQTRN